MISDTITLPPHEIIRYVLEYETGCYTLSFAPVGFVRMPPIIKIEPTQHTDRIKTKLLIRGRSGTWDKKILTGLIPAADHWFYGDQLYKGKKHLLLFQFSPDNQELKVYYNLNLYPTYPTVRANRVQQFIQCYK